MSSRSHLTFAAIDAFDPQGPPTRRLCPLCGIDKPRDSAHRCLSLDRTTGLWKCFRCGEAGKVEEKWEDKSPRHALHQARQNLRQNFCLAVPAPSAPDQLASVDSVVTDSKAVALASQPSKLAKDNFTAPSSSTVPWGWMGAWESAVAVAGTAGERYLQNRALSSVAITHAQLRFCSDWSGRASVVFPICNRGGDLVAVQGRAVKGDAKRTFGPKKEGAFFAPIEVGGRLLDPLDRRAPAIIVVEAPIDALSLATCGFPALALCGTSGPSWLHIVCGLRRVILAFDADEAGDRAAEKLAPTLERFGAKCERMRPDGFKDWNDGLRAERDELTDWLAERIL